jgi:hypothetical protein
VKSFLVTLSFSYVYPNTSEIPQRGGLDERQKLSESVGCSYIEVPADLIKKGSEVTATGQELCSFLTKQSIAILYKSSQNSTGKIPYILHTEPSLSRTDGRIKKKAPLRWNNPLWVDNFVRMILDLSDFLGPPPAKIEIHPGDKRNSFPDIVLGVKVIQSEYEHAFGTIPEVLLENRTGQFISDGEEIKKFWQYIKENDPELMKRFGIVLDIQQLSTVTGQDFLPSFYEIPIDCLKGFHIHRLHKPPKISDGIPWLEVFTQIAGIEHDFIINPEIHHNNQVAGVIGFCKKMIENKTDDKII